MQWIKKIADLAGEISRLLDEGLTLNRVADLISAREKYDNAPSEFLSLIDNLVLTEKEKKILRSILEEDRLGKLAVLTDKGSIKIDKLEILENEQGSKQDLAIKLITFLSKFKNLKGLTVEFSY